MLVSHLFPDSHQPDSLAAAAVQKAAMAGCVLEVIGYKLILDTLTAGQSLSILDLLHACMCAAGSGWNG